MLYLVIICAAVLGLAIMFALFGFGRTATRTQKDEQFNDMVASITRSEIEIEREDSNIPPPNTWSGYWYALSSAAGYRPESTSTPGFLAIGLPVVLFGIGFLVWPRDVIGGIAFAVIAVIGLRIFFRYQANRRIAKMDKQLPNLLSGMRANLAGTATAQQAILSQVDEISAPLGDELRILKDEVAVNVPLDKALGNLAIRVPSREVKFLVASMRIAIESGSDLDPLLETIQEIVVQRTRIANQLASAVAQVQPAIGVTGVMIPAALIFSFYSDEKNRAFWLTLNGAIAAIIVGFLYAAGLFIAKKQVDRVKNS